MDDKRLDELVGWLVDTAKSTETFVVAQAPDVARQIIAWGFWNAVFGLSVCALFVAAGTVMFVRGMRAGKSAEWREGLYIMALVIGAVVALAASPGLFIFGHDIIKITIAPKVYLIQEARQMLK